MADEPKKEHNEEIQGILSDLDSILSGLAPSPAPAAATEDLLPAAALKETGMPLPASPEPPKPIPFIESPPAPVIELSPAPVPPPVEPPKPAPEPAPVVAAAPVLPPAPEPAPVVAAAPVIELPPAPAPAPVIESAAVLPPVEPPKPAPVPAPVEPPPPAPVPAAVIEAAPVEPPPPAPVPPFIDVAPPKLSEIPDKTPKNQIRRVAVIYTPNYVKERDDFIKFLDKTAETLSKKPLYLRKVYVEIFSPADNPTIFLEKMKALGVVAVIGILENLPAMKLRSLSEALAEANLYFRSVPAADVKKKSLSVDLVVDFMLLSPEA